jgi:BASS family bile acid:Na+ symporter
MIFIGEEKSIHLDVMNTILNIFFTIIIPIFIGMSIRYYFYQFALKAQRYLRIILPAILLTVFIVILFFDNNGSENTIRNYIYIAPWALLLNFLSMLVVYLIAKNLRLGGKNNFTVSIEVGLKNSIVGIFVAETLLNNYEMAMVSVVYGSITFFSTLFFGYLAKRIELWGFGYRKLF